MAAAVILQGSMAHAGTRTEQGTVPGASPSLLDEPQVKAAFLYNFLKFIEWPPSRSTGAQYVIGVLGRNPVTTSLEQLVQGRSLNGRPIIVRTIERAQQATAVHILFIGAGEETRFAALQAGLTGAPVVIVGESADFIRSGGTIGFVLQDAKVRFEISPDVAERAGVRISARLQKLATNVRRNSP